MPRQAELRKKNNHWYTGAGGGAYFGRVGEVTYKQAKAAFASHLKAIGSRAGSARGGIATAVLVDLYLDWLQSHRSDRSYDERQRHLQRFINFTAPGTGTPIGKIAATSVRAEDLTEFLAHVAELGSNLGEKGKKLDPFTVGKHQTSVRACVAWGAGRSTKAKNPSPCLPRDFDPFAGIDRHKRPPEPLEEGELATRAEVETLLRHADDDLGLVVEKGRYRSRRADEAREDHPYRGFRDMLTVYHETGARTSELAHARVRHFSKAARQIVLKEHKRSKTMRDTAARRIALPAASCSVVEQLCQGRQPEDPIFIDAKGRAWTRDRLDNRFEHVRDRAGVRKEITIYSFRHLWISDALMAGVDVATVAKMAGTSISMIEKVYGHYRADHLHDAQDRLQAARRAAAEKDAAKPAA